MRDLHNDFNNRYTRSAIYTILVTVLSLSFLMLGTAQYSDFQAPVWNPNQDIIAVTNGIKIRLYSPDLTQMRGEYVLLDSSTTSLVRHGEMLWSPDGTMIAISITGDGVTSLLQVWSLQTGTRILEIAPIVVQAPFVWGLNSDQITVVYADTLGMEVIRIYDIPSGDLLEELTPPNPSNIESLTWNKDGSRMAVYLAGDDTGTFIVDVDTGVFTKSTVTLSPSVVYQLSPTGTLLAGVLNWDDSTVQIVDTTNFQTVSTLVGHTDLIASVTWINDKIITVSWDESTRFWDPLNGQQISFLHTGLISRPSFNPSGTLFVSYLDGEMNYVRDATTGDIIAPSPSVSCSSTIPSADTPALLSAIVSANGTPEADTICLEAGTYIIDTLITSDITLHGLGVGAVVIGSLRVSGAGWLTLRNVSLNP